MKTQIDDLIDSARGFGWKVDESPTVKNETPTLVEFRSSPKNIHGQACVRVYTRPSGQVDYAIYLPPVKSGKHIYTVSAHELCKEKTIYQWLVLHKVNENVRTAAF